MKIRLIILANLILATSVCRSQSTNIDTSVRPVFHCFAGFNEQFLDQYPLVIINGKRFANTSSRNFYFNYDTSNIKNVTIIDAKNDSITLYGKDAKYGVLIFNTNTPIHWTTSKIIFKKYTSKNDSLYTQTLFTVDQDDFAPNEIIYIQKDLIENVEVSKKATAVWGDKLYNHIRITLKKIRGA